jgi:hypothetical protein
MRATLTGLAFAGALSLVCYQSADAVPADAGAMKRAATSASAWPRSIGKLSLATIPWPVSRTAAAQAASAVSMASTRMKRHVETKLIAGAPRAGHIGRTSVTSGIK